MLTRWSALVTLIALGNTLVGCDANGAAGSTPISPLDPQPSGGTGGTAGTPGVGNAGSPGVGTAGSGGTPGAGVPLDTGSIVQVPLSTNQSALLSTVTDDSSSAATPGQFAEQFPVNFATTLPYDPTTAVGMDLIQASSLALDQSELQLLAQNGFVITGRQTFPSFVYGYATAYMLDLPVYISADSILDAVHRSYDDMLMQIEMLQLVEDANTLLTEMRNGLTSISDPQTRADADFYLAVALSLLNDTTVSPLAGGDPVAITTVNTLAKRAEGMSRVVMFGVARDEDFSQFKPRGHYAGIPELEQYFRAMMWLGRVDLRLLETQPTGEQLFHRRQFEAMLALSQLMNAAASDAWLRMDTLIRAFVGESDYMTPPEVPTLIQALGGAATIASLSDEAIAQAIVEGGFGQQLIASHIVFNETNTTLPFNVRFTLFGQRYAIDSHVLSNVVYDRVASRMMPSPLDVAFAALGNNQAGDLLQNEIAQYDYAGNLAGMRSVAENQPEGFWDSNLYNGWLSSLRALSPTPTLDDSRNLGLPSVAKTEAWGRRLLNTQLGSWAELRHDTILYVKQSYTGGATCEFPDAYVDPYPEFFGALGRYTDRLQEVTEIVRSAGAPNTAMLLDRMDDYLARTSVVLTNLGAMAQAERDGVPFTAEQMEFINQAVIVTPVGCTADDVITEGWYAGLFFSPYGAAQFDPTIADVHTQPTDEVGNIVGRVLHAATGMPRLMVVTTESCTAARAYAGLAFAYHEHVTENFQRIDDEEWKSTASGAPVDVPWLLPVMAHAQSAAGEVIPDMMLPP